VNEGHSTENFVPALDYALATVFGPAAQFQQMDSASGPLGMAFTAHAVRLVQQGRPQAAGPFPIISPLDRKTTFLRTLHTWYSCEHLPAPGWFITLKQEPGPPVRSRMAPKWFGAPPKYNPDNYTDAYPWRDLVDLDDYLVYQLARVLSLIVKILNSQFSPEQSVNIAREIAVKNPISLA
jgi:hypothetical protein